MFVLADVYDYRLSTKKGIKGYYQEIEVILSVGNIELVEPIKFKFCYLIRSVMSIPLKHKDFNLFVKILGCGEGNKFEIYVRSRGVAMRDRNLAES